MKLNDEMFINPDGKATIYNFQEGDFVVIKYNSIIKKELFDNSVSEYEIKKEDLQKQNPDPILIHQNFRESGYSQV